MVNVDVPNGEHQHPEILKLSPSGQIPFLVVDGDTFLEANAILRLLCRICPELGSLYPDDAFTKAKVDQMLDFQMSSFGLAIQAAIECFNENRWGNGQIEAKNAGEVNKRLEQKKAKMHEQFAELDRRIQGKTYVCDDQDISGITVADYALGCQAIDLVLFGGNFDKYLNVKRWLGHLLNADS